MWKLYFYNESHKLVHAMTVDESLTSQETAHKLAGRLFQHITVYVIGNHYAYYYTVDAFQTIDHSGMIELHMSDSDANRLLYS